jgi:hypothetical protein
MITKAARPNINMQLPSRCIADDLIVNISNYNSAKFVRWIVRTY